MLHPRPDPSDPGADARVELTDPGYRALAGLAVTRVAPDPPPPWAELVASGWRPSPGDVRRGFGAAAPGRPVAPLVPASRSSAILLLVGPGPTDTEADEAHIVLIERSRSSGTHRGDIAFPGGVLHEGETPEAAALREAHEEIGVRPEHVEIIASLDMVATQTGFLISPFVAVTATYPSFVIERAEIERVLVVPLADLARDGAHWFQTYSPDPRSTQPFFAIGDTVGWGTTGTLLIQLLAAAAAGHRMEESER